MEEVKEIRCDEEPKIALIGHIDTNNAEKVKKKIQEILKAFPEKYVIFDAKDLVYISSAGLRILLSVKKSHPDIQIINVSSEIYEIFDMTGFTQIMRIEKAYKTMSVDGCEVIGWGSNGTVYKYDDETVIKTYNNLDALSEIQNEREMAKMALILGLPTAISYDVVKVGNHYGSVFELLNARSFSKILANEPDKMDWCVQEFVHLMKHIHATEVPEGKLPDMKKRALDWIKVLKDYLDENEYEKLEMLINTIPQSNHMIHGDYHTKNVQLQGSEVLLIDMDTLAVGDPILELAFMFNSFIGYSEFDPNEIMRFQGFDHETAQEFWHKVLSSYLETTDENKITEVEDKARLIGYTRMIRHDIRKGRLNDIKKRREINMWLEELKELIEKTETLRWK